MKTENENETMKEESDNNQDSETNLDSEFLEYFQKIEAEFERVPRSTLKKGISDKVGKFDIFGILGRIAPRS